MLISTNNISRLTGAATADKSISAKPSNTLAGSEPKESFSFSAKVAQHYSPGKILGRAAQGAITGLGVHYFAGSSISSAAKLGATVGGVGGAIIGGITGAAGGGLIGGAGGKAGSGALIGGGAGALIGGTTGAIGGAIEGAVVSVVGNMLGGGAVAYAGAGALLGAVGL